MGAVFKKIWLYLIEKPEMRLLIICWDADGKTTIPYKLKGQEKTLPIWRQCYQGMNGLICMVGGNDRDRIEDAREELNTMMNDGEKCYIVLLVSANKQDLLNAMTVSSAIGTNFGFGVQSVQGS